MYYSNQDKEWSSYHDTNLFCLVVQNTSREGMKDSGQASEGNSPFKASSTRLTLFLSRIMGSFKPYVIRFNLVSPLVFMLYVSVASNLCNFQIRIYGLNAGENNDIFLEIITKPQQPYTPTSFWNPFTQVGE